MAPASAEVPKGSALRLEHGSLHPGRIRLHQLRKAVPIPFLRAAPGALARETNVAEILSHTAGEWCARRGRRSIPIFVAPSQRHEDHTSPDARFGGNHSVAAVPLSLEQRRRPSVSGSGPPRSAPSILAGPRPRRDCNCGARSPLSRPLRSAHGDPFRRRQPLYPGRLYVHEFPAFGATIQRLVDLTQDELVAHILGCHIEESKKAVVGLSDWTNPPRSGCSPHFIIWPVSRNGISVRLN